MFRAAILVVITLTLTVLSAGSAVAGGTLTVTRTDDPAPGECTPSDCSLREAILAVNGGVTSSISLPNGVYVIEQEGAGENDGVTGDFDITKPVIINGANSTDTIINAQEKERIFDIFPDAETTITNVTIANGLTASGGDGGGIRAQSDITLAQVNVMNNTANADFGGGLVVTGGLEAHLTNVSFTGNTSNLGGGGISTYVNTILTVEYGSFRDNTSGNGGAIRAVGSAALRNLVITDNTATFAGGGLDIGYGIGPTVLLEDSEVSGNHANNRGGGVAIGGNATIQRTLISDNTAGERGGGIFNQGTALTVINTTVSGNSANGNGGGISNGELGAGEFSGVHMTISNNTADADGENGGDGGGVFNAGAGNFEIKSTILAGNHDATSDPDCFGEVRLDDRNIVGVASDGCDLLGVGAGDLLDTDPLIGPLVDNGGPTRTHGLLVGSPAVDHGTESPPTDQRGFPRPFGEDADLGAYEAGSLIWGDNNCAGGITPADALPLLYKLADIAQLTSAGDICPAQGDNLDYVTWGNLDCAGGLEQADAVAVLLYVAMGDRVAGVDCPVIGTLLSFLLQ